MFDPIGQFFLRYISLSFATGIIIFLLASGKMNLIENSFRMTMILLCGLLMPIYELLIFFMRSNGAEFIDTS